jgi:hypothetical protein
MNVSKSLSVVFVCVTFAAGPIVAGAQAAVGTQMQNTMFLNGGIGEDEADAMRSRAGEFPLRIIFAEGPRNDFTANVPVAIVDERGTPVFTLRDSGPLLYVVLPPGRYTVIAESDGIRKTHQVTLGAGRGKYVVFHWNAPLVPEQAF